MATELGVDHVVILVNDLAQATRDYEALGFTVTPGGEHERFGTHNALIAFEDESYIELIAEKEPGAGARPVSSVGPMQVASAAERRVESWLNQAEGMVDFALLPTEIDTAVEAAREGGLRLDGPLDGSRMRPDGQRVLWQYAFPDGFDVPFLCADVSERGLRVPDGPAREHSNGVTGILGMGVMVHDFLRSVDRYRMLLGLPEAEGQVEDGAEQTREFEIRGAKLRVMGMVDQHKALPGEPMREGLHTLWLRAQRETFGQLDPAQTHGAQIWWGPEASLRSVF